MSGTENKISFEVHILQGGRWELHASYPADQQAQAIKDAKALENISTVTSVKVIREEMNPDTGASQENNIFASANLPDEEQPKGKIEAQKARAAGKATPVKKKVAKKKKVKKAAPKQNTNMKAGLDIPDEIANFDPEEDEPASFSILGVLIKLLLVILFSAIIASLVAGLAGVWLRDSTFRAHTQSNILFGLFIGSFAISIFSMGMSFLSKAKLNNRRKQKQPHPGKPAQVKPAKVKKDPLPSGFREEAEKAAKEHKEEADQDRKEENEDQEEKKEDPEDEEESEIGVDVDETDNSPWVEKQQKFVMGFLLSALEHGEVDKDKLDNYNKFGINLYIAGACETLSQKNNLDGRTMSSVISKPVSYMGFKKRDAEAFADRIQGYLLADSKYMQAYQAGRSAMKSHFDDDPEAKIYLKRALEEWNKPKDQGESSGPVTVLFTDIAGSTNMTQTLGDAVAQQIVRAHNRIVREALTKFKGKEIKHTGDGIMASFSSTSNGVEAAADMQAGTLKHNANFPDLPLGLKIGLNAGEPIEEDNDLFGSTVQMAARIVDKAQASQIFVSATVYGICDGKNYTFIKRGPFEMKGFDSEFYLHEMVWDEKSTPPEAEAEVEVEAEQEPELETRQESGSEEPAETAETGADTDADPDDQEPQEDETPPGPEEEAAQTAEAPVELPDTPEAPADPQPEAAETPETETPEDPQQAPPASGPDPADPTASEDDETPNT